MNKTIYNRKFNSLIKNLDKIIIPDFKSDVVCLNGVPGHEGCMGFTYWFGEQEIQIIRKENNSSYYSSIIGIHLDETDALHLQDQLEVALRDGFKNIIIHSIASKKEIK
jgi:hypothetical protein